MNEPISTAPALMLAALLAALAGMVDAIGYLLLGHLFVSFMSGNTTQLAVAVAHGDLAEGKLIAELIGLFVVGAAAGQILAGSTGRWHLTSVLGAVTALLAITASQAIYPEPMVLAMGALNASMHRAGKVAVSLTYITGMLVRFGQGLGDLLARRSIGWDWLTQASPWPGLFAGAVIGGIFYLRLGEAAVWLPVALAALLALCSAVVREPD